MYNNKLDLSDIDFKKLKLPELEEVEDVSLSSCANCYLEKEVSINSIDYLDKLCTKSGCLTTHNVVLKEKIMTNRDIYEKISEGNFNYNKAIVLASSHFLIVALPESWDDFTEEELNSYLYDNRWEPLEDWIVTDVFPLIENLAEDIINVYQEGEIDGQYEGYERCLVHNNID